MRAREVVRAPRGVAAALLVLLVAQGAAVAGLRPDAAVGPAPVSCGTDVPPVSRRLPIDAQLQLRAELTVGGSSSGAAVIVNRGSRAVAVLASQAVLLAPSGLAPATRPEKQRPASALLRPGQFLRQPLTVTLRPCAGGRLSPGFYELALVVVAQRVDDDAPVRTTTSRVAVVVRPAPG